MKTLIKTDNSLILVSDEEIKEGDKFYNGESILKCSRVTNILIDINGLWSKIKDCKKVLSQSPKLSKPQVDKIGWIDVEELAEKASIEYANKWFNPNAADRVWDAGKENFKNGFQKAQELNQKKYSEEELLNILDKYQVKCQLVYNEGTDPDAREWYANNKKSLFQNQWRVEAEEIDGVWNVTKIIK